MFNTEVSVGNLVAAGAVLISAAALLATFAKERALKTKELADKVRQSSSLVAAKLDRWKQLAVQSFDQLQGAATDADGHLLEKNDEILTRDMFWKHVVSAQSDLVKRVLDEEIELAYSSLFGYDPKVHELYTGAISALKEIQSLVFLQLLNRTQSEILEIRAGLDRPMVSAQLGNRLRFRLAESKKLLEDQMETIVSSFRSSMAALICATDEDLVRRKIRVAGTDALPSLAALREIVSEPDSAVEREDDGDTNEALRQAFQDAMENDSMRCEMVFRHTRSTPLGSQMIDPWTRQPSSFGQDASRRRNPVDALLSLRRNPNDLPSIRKKEIKLLK